MGITVVQNCDEVSANVAERLAQERHHLILSDVVPEEHSKESKPPPRWAHRDTGNHRDSFVGEVVADQRGAAHRCPCPSDRRGEHKARFIYENQVGAQP